MSLLSYGILIAVVFVLLLLYFAYRQITLRSGDDIPNIAVHFSMNRRLALDIQEQLKQYIARHGEDALFYPSQSFGAFLAQFERQYGSFLRQRSYPYGKRLMRHADIESACNAMEAQFHELLQVKRELALRLAQDQDKRSPK